MKVELLGYSERGMINALCDDIRCCPELLSEFLSWFWFPEAQPRPGTEGIRSATLLVEQSFSDFGDLDLLILLDFEYSKPQAVLVEAKVSTETGKRCTINRRWTDFLAMVNETKEVSSNLFVQLYRKAKLVQSLSGCSATKSDRHLLKRGKIGKNSVVLQAWEELRNHVPPLGDAFFAAVAPDALYDLTYFSGVTLARDLDSPIREKLPAWNAKGWGFLSWHTVSEKMRENEGKWARSVASLKWNEPQIFGGGRLLPRHAHSLGPCNKLLHQRLHVAADDDPRFRLRVGRRLTSSIRRHPGRQPLARITNRTYVAEYGTRCEEIIDLDPEFRRALGEVVDNGRVELPDTENRELLDRIIAALKAIL
jgi:hypothetical protein